MVNYQFIDQKDDVHYVIFSSENLEKQYYDAIDESQVCRVHAFIVGYRIEKHGDNGCKVFILSKVTFGKSGKR